MNDLNDIFRALRTNIWNRKVLDSDLLQTIDIYSSAGGNIYARHTLFSNVANFVDNFLHTTIAKIIGNMQNSRIF